MRTIDEKVDDDRDGFVEVPISSGDTGKGGQGGQAGQAGDQKGNKPDFRIVQPEVDKDGKTIYRSVGGMWKRVSKNGNEFYSLMIGNLKLLVFPNDKK
ncbi:TPA: DUF736 domain-containing protein [Candidatus Micrarchaeota archaeon]|nr:DUF736 domain-containing protein [Candidatus Micrarchaeota archaeon]